MKKINFNSSKSINLFLVLGFFLLPIALFLNSTNIPQLNLNDVYYLIIVQLFFLIIITIVSFIFYYIFFRQKISLINFLILNSFYFFILFYFRKVLNFFSFFDQVFFLIDNIVTCLLYLFLYYLTFKIIIKYQIKIKKFFTIYIIINLFIFITTFIPKNNYEEKFLENNKITFNNNFDLSKINENNENYHVFIVILDAMINLEAAEQKNIITSKEDYKNKLKKNNFIYVDNFHANYPNTYLSVATILNGVYPVTSNSPRYKTRESFFPGMLLQDELGLKGSKEFQINEDKNNHNNFFSILKKISADFFYIGNSWGRCYPNELVKCLSSNKYSYFFTKVYPMYFYSFFRYFFDFYDQDNTSSVFNFFRVSKLSDDKIQKPLNSLDFLFDINFYENSKVKFSKTTFFLLHVLSPHPSSHVFFKDCTKTYVPELDNFAKSQLYKDFKEKELYSYAYKCLFDTALQWSKEISEVNKKNIVVILGDHGMNFNIDNDDYTKLSNRLNNVFLSVKIPDECKSLELPRSHVNILRYILNCTQKTNLNYLENQKFITRYEDHRDFGLAIPYEE